MPVSMFDLFERQRKIFLADLGLFSSNKKALDLTLKHFNRLHHYRTLKALVIATTEYYNQFARCGLSMEELIPFQQKIAIELRSCWSKCLSEDVQHTKLASFLLRLLKTPSFYLSAEADVILTFITDEHFNNYAKAIDVLLLNPAQPIKIPSKGSFAALNFEGHPEAQNMQACLSTLAVKHQNYSEDEFIVLNGILQNGLRAYQKLYKISEVEPSLAAMLTDSNDEPPEEIKSNSNNARPDMRRPQH